MADLFDFEWYVDQRGYEAVSAEELPEGMDRPILDDPPKTGWFLRRKGGPLRWYRPLEEHPGLFRRFACLPYEPQEILRFANEFGLLGANRVHDFVDGDLQEHLHEREEDVLWWRPHITYMHDIVEGIDLGNENSMAEAFNRSVVPPMRPRIEVEHGKRRSLQIAPTTLLAAMWFQVAGELTDGTKFKKCLSCSNWFPFGKGTGHRQTKSFCGDACRKRWHRHKEKEGQK